MRRISPCWLLFALVVCTAIVPAQVKISQVYGGGGNTGAPVTRDYIELYNTSSSPVTMTNWSVQYAAATSTFTTSQTVVLNGTIPANGYWLVGMLNNSAATTTANAPGIPLVDASGTTDMSATTGKIALCNTSTVLTSGTPTTTGFPALVDFVGFGTTANWNEPATTGGANTTVNDAPAPSATLAVYRNNCGAADTEFNKDDWANGAPSPRNSQTPPNLGLTAIGTVFPFIALQGEVVSMRCSPRLCGTSVLTPGTTVTVDLTAFGMGVTAMHDDGLMGDDLAGDGLFMLNVTVPAGQAAGSYQFPLFANDGSSSGGSYLALGVVTSASAPLNDNCINAAPLAIPSTTAVLFTGANVESNPILSSITAPTSGVGARRGRWYTVTGTGNTITASTCSGTIIDSVLLVFCGTCDGLSEVTSSDDAGTTLCPAGGSAAVASWCSTMGQNYYVWIAPFAVGASTVTLNLLLSDNGTPCSGAMPCPTCPLAAPVAQSEAEARFGTATNDGCDSSAGLFTTIATPGFPGSTFNGTARSMGGNRDSDWYRFQATTSDTLNATVTGQTEGYLVSVASLAAGGVCPATTLATSTLSGRCASTSISVTVTAGTWYAVKVLCNGIEGSPAGAIQGGQIPSASNDNYVLSIQVGGPPPNDNCAGATNLALPSVVAGTTNSATNDGMASCDPSGALGRDLWYKFTLSGTTSVHLDTCGSAVDTTLAVYSGVCGSLVELVGGCSDDANGCPCNSPAAALDLLNLAAGTYTVRVSTKTVGGSFSLAIKAIALLNDDCCGAIPVACGSVTNGTTVGATAEVGLPAACIGPVVPVQSNNFAYTNSVWYTVTAPPTGGTMYADTLASALDSKIWVWTGMCGALQCVTANDDIKPSPFQSKTAWKANPNQQYFVMVGPFSTAGAFTLTVGCASTPANDDCSTPTSLSPAPGGSIAGTTIGATCSEVYTSTSAFPSCASSGGIFDVWYSYTACANANVTFTTCGAYDTTMSIHTTCPGLAGPNNQIAGACNNDGASCGLGSSLTIPVTTGTTYLIRVVGALGGNPEGNFTLTWAADGPVFYQDNDSDGFGNPASSVVACLQPGGYVTNNQDCNDNNFAIKPGAVEVCDGIDNDCDTLIDDMDPGIVGQTTWYQDFDGDSYGNPAVTQLKCFQPTGYVSNTLDCDDSNGAINPAAVEICDGLDNDCDLAIDDADTSITGQTTWYQDFDGDTYGNAAVTSVACSQPAGYVANNTDCNDTNSAVNPAGVEVCNNIDDDCDSIVDEVCPPNDHCASATVIADGTFAGDNSLAGSENGSLTCGAVTNDVWYSYTNPLTCTWSVTVSLCPADGGGAAFDAVLHAFSACGGALIACNDSFCGTNPKLTFSLAGGATALIAVSAVAPGPGGNFSMVVSHSSASFSQLGPGCSDGGGPGPTLTIDAPPVICSNRLLTITGASPAASGMLMFSLPGTPTGLTGGCTLYLNQGSMNLLFFIGTDPFGNWASFITVPCDPLLECATFTVQGILFPTSPPPFYQVTSGLSVTLGL